MSKGCILIAKLSDWGLKRSVGLLFEHLLDTSGNISLLLVTLKNKQTKKKLKDLIWENSVKSTKRNCYFSVRFIGGEDKVNRRNFVSAFHWESWIICCIKWFEQIFRHGITHLAAGKISQQPTVSILKRKYYTVDLLLTLISFYVLQMRCHSLFLKQTPTIMCYLEISGTWHKLKALFLGMPFTKTFSYIRKGFYNWYDSRRRAAVCRYLHI